LLSPPDSIGLCPPLRLPLLLLLLLLLRLPLRSLVVLLLLLLLLEVCRPSAGERRQLLVGVLLGEAAQVKFESKF
jgi:hypothetical protein